MLVEIISTTFDQALQAKKYGADRIELVNGMLEEGLTPSLGVIKKIKENDDFVLYRYATEQTKGTKITSLLLQFHSTPYPFRLFGTICQSLLKRHCSPSSRSRNSIYLKAVFPSGFHGKRSSTGRC